MLNTLMLNSMMMSIIFMTMNHPISLGFILLMQTISISLISSFYSYSFWMSYILFLIMIGGMLILFTYIASMASNETFKMSMKIMLIIMTTSMIFIYFLTLDKSYSHQMIKLLETSPMMNKHSIQENSPMLNKMYNKPSNMISLILINYLFLTLVIVVKITNIQMGPLRQKF